MGQTGVLEVTTLGAQSCSCTFKPPRKEGVAALAVRNELKGTEGPGRQARFALCNLDIPSETQKATRRMEEEKVMNKRKRSMNLPAAIPSSSFTSKCSNRPRRFPSNTILGARESLGYSGNHITCTPAPEGVSLRRNSPRILILLWSSILRRFQRADLPQ